LKALSDSDLVCVYVLPGVQNVCLSQKKRCFFTNDFFRRTLSVNNDVWWIVWHVKFNKTSKNCSRVHLSVV